LIMPGCLRNYNKVYVPDKNWGTMR